MLLLARDGSKAPEAVQLMAASKAECAKSAIHFDEFPTSYLCLFMFNSFILLYMFVVDFPASHVFTAKGSYNIYKNIID